MLTPALKALYEDRDVLVKEIVRLRDVISQPDHKITAEEESQWAAANADLTEIEKKIQITERADAVESQIQAEEAAGEEVAKKLRRAGGVRRDEETAVRRRSRDLTEEHRALALQAWVFAQSGKQLREEHLSASRTVGVDLHAKEIELSIGGSSDAQRYQREFRAMSVGVDAAGGYTVPTGFVSELEKALLAFGSVRRAARILRTSSGNDLQWPTVNDTANKGALIGENTADSEQDVATGILELKAYKYTSRIVRVSAELLQDSAFDMAAELGRILGERLGRILEEHYTTGTGSSQPNGVVTASTLGKTAASATAITADEVIDLVHSVDLGYRVNGLFMLHDLVLATVRKLKDQNNLYLWQPNLQFGIPPTLYGYRYEVNQEMDGVIDASSKVMLFGDFKKFLVREVATIRLKRLTERYAEYDQEAFVAYVRGDSDLLDAGTHPIKHLITAAT